ncbi:MAG: hypothetical protein GY922_17675 [Proteobacteria bacterium]|nr:hypothetical protein [Pseudomonadota bacterium]
MTQKHGWHELVTPVKRGKARKAGANEEVRISAECHAATTRVYRLKRVFNMDSNAARWRPVPGMAVR